MHMKACHSCLQMHMVVQRHGVEPCQDMQYIAQCAGSKRPLDSVNNAPQLVDQLELCQGILLQAEMLNIPRLLVNDCAPDLLVACCLPDQVGNVRIQAELIPADPSHGLSAGRQGELWQQKASSCGTPVSTSPAARLRVFDNALNSSCLLLEAKLFAFELLLLLLQHRAGAGATSQQRPLILGGQALKSSHSCVKADAG